MAGDLLRPETLPQAVNGMQAVVHLAAFFRGATPEQNTAVNQDGALALAQAALQSGVPRFVFISTNLVYGPGRGRPAHEGDTPQPAQPYPRSKAAAEQALQDLYHGRQLDLHILRLAFVYGEGDPHLREFMPRLQHWNPRKRLHMVHHADVAQAIMLALDAARINGVIYNVADDEPVSVAEVLQLHGERSAEDAAAQPLDDPWEGIVETTRIRNELGFRPIYPNLRAAVAAGAL
jgi:nucleoside-diphosphate-sugar epimerase